MGVALAANAPQLVNVCKMNATMYQLYMLPMLGIVAEADGLITGR